MSVLPSGSRPGLCEVAADYPAGGPCLERGQGSWGGREAKDGQILPPALLLQITDRFPRVQRHPRMRRGYFSFC